ncbi:hypothetical protein BRC62_00505 [Halobacteriales archaeon QH_10_67_13]|nr:MAG: hypothetical protein BRC62_00505 [Halobacteriales archaeon QH_10_67_13]
MIEPAETPMGAAIRPESAFTDGLRIRLFVRARDSLERLGGSREGLTVSASLPETKTPAQLRAARDAVAVGRAGENGSKLRVRIANVTLTATRDGREVANRTVSPTIVVDSPVLVVRDRIEEFERRLGAGVTDRGLARRLSAQLHTAVFARGYAQYGGAPIQNVLGNRHVELFTNRALFGVQRSVFGHSDPVGREALRAATVETGLTDLLGGINRTGVDHLEAAREYARLTRESADRLAGLAATETYPAPGDAVTTGINESARHVFLAYLGNADVGRVGTDRASPEGIDSHVTHTLLTYASVHDAVTLPEYDFAAAIDRTFTERARLAGAVDRLDRSRRTNATPGPDWSAIGQDTETTTTVRDRETAPPPTDRGWTRHAHYPRTVERTQTTTTRYRTPNGTRTIQETVTETYAVDLSVLGRHARAGPPGGRRHARYRSDRDPGGIPRSASNGAVRGGGLAQAGGGERLDRKRQGPRRHVPGQPAGAAGRADPRATHRPRNRGNLRDRRRQGAGGRRDRVPRVGRGLARHSGGRSPRGARSPRRDAPSGSLRADAGGRSRHAATADALGPGRDGRSDARRHDPVVLAPRGGRQRRGARTPQ